MGQKKWTTKAAEIRKGEQGKAGQEVITAGQNGEECWKGQSRAGQGRGGSMGGMGQEGMKARYCE